LQDKTHNLICSLTRISLDSVASISATYQGHVPGVVLADLDVEAANP